jgi:hypothetical protein
VTSAKALFFVLFELITKYAFCILSLKIDDLWSIFVFYHSKNQAKNIGCKGRYSYVYCSSSKFVMTCVFNKVSLNSLDSLRSDCQGRRSDRELSRPLAV